MKEVCLEMRLIAGLRMVFNKQKLIGFNIKHTWRWINADASYKPQQVASAIIYTKPHKNQHKHNIRWSMKRKQNPYKTKNPQQRHAKKNSNQHTRNLDDQLLSQFSLHETLVELMGLRDCTAVFADFFRAQSLGAHGGCVLYCLQASRKEIEKCGYQVWWSEEQRRIRIIGIDYLDLCSISFLSLRVNI